MVTTFQGGPAKVPAERAGPVVARHAGPAKREVTDVLVEGRRRGTPRAGADPRAMLALQRQAGNAAVGALMAAKLKSPGDQAGADIDAALKEIRKNEPAIGTVEKGLKAAQTAGVPVELEGPKPPAAALAVTKTGFGPGSVAAKKPVPPPKPVPAVSPLGKAGAVKAGGARAGAAKTGGPAKGAAGAGAPLAASGGGAAAAAVMAPTALPADKLLQPPVAPVPVRPEADPAFAQVTGSISGVAQSRKAHPPAAAKAQEAQSAALPPTDDVAGQAKTAKVDAMDAQQPGTFDKQAFIAAVKAAIEAKSPKTLEEADEYKKSGKAGEAKGQVKGLVSQGKAGQSKDIEVATAAPPDSAKAVPKPVTPMTQEQPGQVPAVPAAGAAPKPAPAEQVNLAAGPHQANQEMVDAEVSEQQLAQSNEPEFQQGLADKKATAEHAQTAPAEFRQQEQQVLQQGKADAGAETAAGVTGMQNAKATALANLVADKGKTKSKDESRRAEVTAKVQAIFAATEADVKKILDGIDPEVEAAFEAGEAGARSTFEAYVEAKMSAYKKDRYGGWLGGYRWLRDKIAGMPAKVNEFYEAGRELYLTKMNVVISNVADIVGRALTAAKQRIAKGRSEISTYVAGLPSDLQKVGAEATKEIGDKFEALESDVNAKQESVVDALATKYVEARKGLDERIEALQAENKGLVEKAIGAIKGIINTIRELAGMLRNVLSRAAGVVGDIIKNPVAFLGNLIEGVKGGILKFRDNILGHLKKGLMGWLFGALAEGGVEIPDTFDIKGIIKLLASIFGLTWANIRNRIAKQIGEPAMAAVEKGVEIFQVIASQGVAGLWQMLLEKLGNIKDMILDQVKDFVITKVITAGITWLIGLLNPAAAFIKACKLIYDVVMFFVNNAERIMKFVNTIIDSVADIVRGNVSSVVKKIEDVLGQMVPILIGFLASVIGLGGIGQKIRQIIESLQKPFHKALDFVVKTGLKLAGPIIRGIKGFAGKVKAGAKKLLTRARDKLSPKKRPAKTATDKEQLARRAANDGFKAATSVSLGRIEGALAAVKSNYAAQGVKELRLKPTSEHQFTVVASVNPDGEAEKKGAVDLDPKFLPLPAPLSMKSANPMTRKKSYETTASGAFYADHTPDITSILTSGNQGSVLKLTDSHKAAHAEEQVVNSFELGWRSHAIDVATTVVAALEKRRQQTGKTTAKRGRKASQIWADRVRMSINVTKSSCINCASHIVSFTEMMRRKAKSVKTRVSFASLYQGPQQVPKPTMIKHGDLIRAFVENGKLTGSNRLSRLWGRLTRQASRRERATEVGGGPQAGRAGLAILRKAGIEVKILKQNDLDTSVKPTKVEQERLEYRNEVLKDALDTVNRDLKNIKA